MAGARLALLAAAWLVPPAAPQYSHGWLNGGQEYCIRVGYIYPISLGGTGLTTWSGGPWCDSVCAAAGAPGANSSVLLGYKIRTKLDAASDCGPLPAGAMISTCAGFSRGTDSSCEPCTPSNPNGDFAHPTEFQAYWNYAPPTQDACAGGRTISPVPGDTAATITAATYGHTPETRIQLDNYKDDTTCSWTIRCSPGSQAKLVLEPYELDSGEQVTVTYDLNPGETVSQIYGNQHSGTTLTSTSTQLTMTFTSDGNSNFLVEPIEAEAFCEDLNNQANILPPMGTEAPFLFLAWDRDSDTLVVPDPAISVAAGWDNRGGRNCNDASSQDECSFNFDDTTLNGRGGSFLYRDPACTQSSCEVRTPLSESLGASGRAVERVAGPAFEMCLGNRQCYDTGPDDATNPGYRCDCATATTGLAGRRCEQSVGFARIAMEDDGTVLAGANGNLTAQSVMLGGRLDQTVYIKHASDSSPHVALVMSTVGVQCIAPDTQCQQWLTLSNVPNALSIAQGEQVPLVLTYNAAVAPVGTNEATLVIDGMGASAHIELHVEFVVTESSYVVLALPQNVECELMAGETATRSLQLFNVRTTSAVWAVDCTTVALPAWLSLQNPVDGCTSSALSVAPGTTAELVVLITVPQQVPTQVLSYSYNLLIPASVPMTNETLSVPFVLKVLPRSDPNAAESTAAVLNTDGSEAVSWTLTAGDSMMVDVAARDMYGNAIIAPGLRFKLRIVQDLVAEQVPVAAAWDVAYLSRFEPGTETDPINKYRLTAPRVPSRGVFNVTVSYVETGNAATDPVINTTTLTVQPVDCTQFGLFTSQSNALGTQCECLPGNGFGSNGRCGLCSITVTGMDVAESNLHSATGICVACSPGKQPNGLETACVECHDGWASQNGRCSACGPGKRPVEGRSRCEFCPVGKETESSNDTHPVWTTNGTTCVQCAPGKARDQNNEFDCTECEEGKAPVLPSMRECATCAAGEVRNDTEFECRMCPAGKEPNDPMKPVECKQCGPTEHKMVGNTTCIACLVGKQPNPGRTSCSVCPANFAGMQGACTRCGAGKIANNESTLCVACGIGKQRSPIFNPNAVNAVDVVAVCVDCDPDSASDPAAPGTCIVCHEKGKVPNAANTACVQCTSNKQPIVPPDGDPPSRTACSCDVGYFVDPDGCKRPDVENKCPDGTAPTSEQGHDGQPRAPCCSQRNQDHFHLNGNGTAIPRTDTVEADDLVCDLCPKGAKCFKNNLVVARPGQWVDPTGLMVPRVVKKNDDATIVSEEIQGVACLPLNCVGYCSVAFDNKEGFSTVSDAPDCSKSVWKQCSSHVISPEDNSAGWQSAVQTCYKEGEGLSGWRQALRSDSTAGFAGVGEWVDWPARAPATSELLTGEQVISQVSPLLSEEQVDTISVANFCRHGSTGRVCSTCLDFSGDTPPGKKYIKVEGTCVSCTGTDYMSIVKSCLLYSLFCFFFVHKSRRVITGRDCDIHNSSCIIGIVVFFIQTMTLLRIDLGLSGVRGEMTEVMRMQMDSPEQDDDKCLGTGAFYYDYATKYFVPVFMLSCSGLMAVVFKLKKWQQKMTMFFTLQYCLFPINLRSLQIWFCRSDLHAETTYLRVDPAVPCGGGDYWLAAIVFMGILAVFAFAGPFFLYQQMKMNMQAHEKLLTIECYLNFGFERGKQMIERGELRDRHSPEYAARDYLSVLYYPLRRQTFWWGIVWMLRPTLVAFFYNGRDRSTDVWEFGGVAVADWRVMVLLMLMCYNCIQASIRPFKHSNESALDAFSVLLLMFVFVVNINQDFMTRSGADTSDLQIVNLVVILVLLSCIVLATVHSKNATNAHIARLVARSRWKNAWNAMSSDTNDPLADIGSLADEVEKAKRKESSRFSKLKGMGLQTKLPIFEQVDVDGSGNISLPEFLGWWTLRTLRAGCADDMKEVAEELFSRFDVVGSGEVDRTEFDQILIGLREWHAEQQALMAQIEEPIGVKQAAIIAEVGRVVANMHAHGWFHDVNGWHRPEHPPANTDLNPVHGAFEVESKNGCATQQQHHQQQQHQQPAAQADAPTVEEVFEEIDTDGSGELSFIEFQHWWRTSRGDEETLGKAQEAFQLVEIRDGIPGVSIAELTEVMVAIATDSWEEAVDPPTGRKYFVNPATRQSSWVVPGIECVQPFLLAAGITRMPAAVQQPPAVPARPPAAPASRPAPQLPSPRGAGLVAGQAAMRIGSHLPSSSDLSEAAATSQPAATPAAGGGATGLMEGLRQSKFADSMIKQMLNFTTGEVNKAEFGQWWETHKQPDLQVIQSLKFSRALNKAFDANSGRLQKRQFLECLAGMWEEKQDPGSGRAYYVNTASKQSLWVFGVAQADAWLQECVVL